MRDTSKKVGGRRNTAPRHTTGDRKQRGRLNMCEGGRKGYNEGKCRGKETG